MGSHGGAAAESKFSWMLHYFDQLIVTEAMEGLHSSEISVTVYHTS